MSDIYLMGVDLGTMGTKAALFNQEGELIAEAYEESILRYPKPGRVEQELDEIYTSAVNCIKAVLEQSKIDSAKVEGLAFSSQMSGIGMIDKDWQPVAHYDSWLDTRCEESFDLMEPLCDNFTAGSGCPPTYAHASKMIWWKNNHPEVFKQVTKFIVPLTYVAGKMAGLAADQAYIDETCLHFSGFSETDKLKWSEELLNRYEIPKDKTPRIISSTEIIGNVNSEASRLTGLKEGTPIAAGAGDQAAAAFGAGVVNPGDVFDNAGTASVCSICVDQFKPDVDNKVVLATRGVIPGTFYALSFINGGGLNLRWFRDTFGLQEKEKAGDKVYQVFDEMAADVPAGSEGTIFIPHLQGRVTPPDPTLRGLWVGFTWAHNRGHLFRSILEGIAYEYAYYLQIEQNLHPDLNCREVRVIGGGASSNLWNQIKCDILNIPYCRINRSEVGTWGCAMIAGKAVGLFDDLAAAAKQSSQVVKRFEPRKEYNEFYKPYVAMYSRILEQYSDVFSGLSALPTEHNQK